MNSNISNPANVKEIASRAFRMSDSLLDFRALVRHLLLDCNRHLLGRKRIADCDDDWEIARLNSHRHANIDLKDTNRQKWRSPRIKLLGRLTADGHRNGLLGYGIRRRDGKRSIEIGERRRKLAFAGSEQ